MGIKVPQNDLVLQDVAITFRNFAGAQSEFNAAGDRNFAVWIDDPVAAENLEAMGWKVKRTKAREEGDEPRAYMPVSVKYHPKLRPPMVKMITSRGIENLDEEAVDVLDFMDIAKVDLILRPFHWKLKNGNEGVKNMLKSIYVTIREDELEVKYAELPVVGAGSDQRAISASDPWGNGLEDLGEIAEAENLAIEQGRF